MMSCSLPGGVSLTLNTQRVLDVLKPEVTHVLTDRDSSSVLRRQPLGVQKANLPSQQQDPLVIARDRGKAIEDLADVRAILFPQRGLSGIRAVQQNAKRVMPTLMQRPVAVVHKKQRGADSLS
jgi:hypothetical protein